MSCLPPATTHPIGSTAGLRNDPAFTGLWRAKAENADDGDRDLYLHFLPAPDGTITVVMVKDGTKQDGGWSIASITTAALGANHFINAQLTFSDGKMVDPAEASGTTPLLYRFDGPNHAAMFFLDEDATKAAIKAGWIKGTVEEGQFGDAKITADPKSLDAFMASKRGVALFGERFITMTKME
ncbi:MAG TPA: hypothetical protein VIJ85_02080 [Rhizomicrobium sp.]